MQQDNINFKSDTFNEMAIHTLDCLSLINHYGLTRQTLYVFTMGLVTSCAETAIEGFTDEDAKKFSDYFLTVFNCGLDMPLTAETKENLLSMTKGAQENLDVFAKEFKNKIISNGLGGGLSIN